ncbi:MAG: peptidylprolyl isomerase [Cyclobacteriaceae bacterium]|nr:peptidylprolyl isomerase [Cyclobacteriaceae bacterium]
MLRLLFLVSIALVLVSCKKREAPINTFADPVLIRIADFQDRRLTDSLKQFLSHPNAEYRKAAVLAFGSVQDTLAVQALSLLLADPDSSVRIAATFALGQTGGSNTYELLRERNEINSEFFEALGKTIPKEKIDQPIDNPWGLYRLALRGLADSSHVNQVLGYLRPESNLAFRLGAAHFFSRGPADIQAAEQELVNSLQSDSSAYVRMAVALALRKIKTDNTREALRETARNDRDYRVRVNAVRALQAFPLNETVTTLFDALSDAEINVSIASAETLVLAAKPEQYAMLVDKARAVSHWRVKANVYEAALAANTNKTLIEEIIRLDVESENVYAKAAFISSLKNSPMAYAFIGEQLLTSAVPVIQSTAASTLISMNKHKLFDKSMRPEFLSLYKKALEGNDAAIIGTVAMALMDPKLGYKDVITDYGFLYTAKEKLSLPQDNEALQPLEQAIAYFEGKDRVPEVKNEFNHPIDWELIKSIPDKQHAIIKTTKGDITIQLLVDEAPGSVLNFVQLASSGYYNGKYFHRVVPNFVIQGGCHRGDGWGSEDYSIRSEFSTRRYKEGSVGMASAGKDTEGTQWFITHSPTPHLDGRYTLFAEVVSGMEVVHRIEVGDEIFSVELVTK